MIEDFERYPLPPPWRRDATEMTYINDDTGEVTTIHPYQRLLDKRAAAQQEKQSPASEYEATGQRSLTGPGQGATGTGGSTEAKESFRDGLGTMREDSSDGPLFVGESTSLVAGDGSPQQQQQQQQQQQMVEATGAAAAADDTMDGHSSVPIGVPLTNKELRQRMKKHKHTDFRCLWKELSLMGETNSYGLVIRYYPDGQTVIKFDGVDGQWYMSRMLGPYGPLDRYDLFVGAKVNVFGRHLTINSCSASTCHWIEEEGNRLAKQQEWLQKRVESLGEVCIVRRAPPLGPLSNQGRSSKPAGGVNLRMLHVGNSKLLEQLAKLGMGDHCKPPEYYTKPHKKDTEENFYTL